MIEFTYNKNQIFIDADNVLKVIPSKPQEFDDTGMDRHEYWKTKLGLAVRKNTCLVFKNAAENGHQFVDQTAEEAIARLTGNALPSPDISK